MKNRFALTVLAAIALVACSDATAPSDELTAARRRWEAWGPTSYDLVVQRGPCECIPFWLERVVVSVRGDAVTRYYLDTLQPVTEAALQHPAAPGLFDMIASEIAAGRTVEVKYDALTGVPLQIDVDRQDWPVDGGSSLTIELRKP